MISLSLLLTQEIRAQEERENAESLGCEPGQRPGGTGVRVSTNMATPANMLTDREMECITTVFRCVISVHEVTISIEKTKNLTQRSFETGLRGATIYPSVSRYLRILVGANIERSLLVYQDLHPAMKMLGLNPSEQEVVDIPNNIAKYESGRFFLCRSKSNESSLYRKGLIYFPEFCQLILKWFRDNKEAKENFNQNMFKVSHGILLHHKMCT